MSCCLKTMQKKTIVLTPQRPQGAITPLTSLTSELAKLEYLIYIQCFRKAIHLEILSFGATEAGRKLGGDFQRGEAEKVMRRAEKVASRAGFTPSEGKNKKGKNAVMGQKCTFLPSFL